MFHNRPGVTRPGGGLFGGAGLVIFGNVDAARKGCVTVAVAGMAESVAEDVAVTVVAKVVAMVVEVIVVVRSQST